MGIFFLLTLILSMFVNQAPFNLVSIILVIFYISNIISINTKDTQKIKII